MIAKIGRGSNMFGALSYNYLKVEDGNARILTTHRMIETPDGSFSIAQLGSSFAPYLMANHKTEKPVLHISLNPDPDDKVTDEDFRNIAKEYMERMGYGDQPYVVFKHEDIQRTHIHIVSTCVDRFGKKIDDRFEKRRSMDICRAIEKKYQLKPATEKKQEDEILFRPVDYKGKDIKSQIASVVRYLPKYYQFQNLGTYNALLSLFNITAEQVSGELHGKPRSGLVYFALNENGEKASNPFKASRFGKYAGLAALQKHFEASKENMKTSQAKAVLKSTVEVALNISTDEEGFKKELINHGINAVIRRNEQGRIYGITFIDHESRTVWNGSQLNRTLSANTFNERWNETVSDRTVETEKSVQSTPVSGQNNRERREEIHPFFDFVNREPTDDFGWLSIIPQAQESDYEELAFEYAMKKKKKRKRGYRR